MVSLKTRFTNGDLDQDLREQFSIVINKSVDNMTPREILALGKSQAYGASVLADLRNSGKPYARASILVLMAGFYDGVLSMGVDG